MIWVWGKWNKSGLLVIIHSFQIKILCTNVPEWNEGNIFPEWYFKCFLYSKIWLKEYFTQTFRLWKEMIIIIWNKKNNKQLEYKHEELEREARKRNQLTQISNWEHLKKLLPIFKQACEVVFSPSINRSPLPFSVRKLRGNVFYKTTNK